MSSFNCGEVTQMGQRRFEHNPMELQSEILAAILRCQIAGIRCTIGQVEKHLINIRVTRTIIKKQLQFLIDWAVISCIGFKYRKNINSCEYTLSQLYGGYELAIHSIMFNASLAPHFPQFAEKYPHA